jgi:hypothetical protein
VLSGTVAGTRGKEGDATLTLPQAARVVGAWSLAHGFSMLLLDGRLKPLLASLPAGADADTLLAATFSSAGPRK